ncbi:hypothetical protein E2562_009010 [Oryza meyeriana var. granulata]|uniref:Uncharacterized protein n=1 Tax=Oryza meyeriana var. granulata TaxID=110450 RepID=A0A6G1D0R6_9ORYZ|nr:hypothetical protein E2562_009010 [Oryza meyeriana var. granulata]
MMTWRAEVGTLGVHPWPSVEAPVVGTWADDLEGEGRLVTWSSPPLPSSSSQRCTEPRPQLRIYRR